MGILVISLGQFFLKILLLCTEISNGSAEACEVGSSDGRRFPCELRTRGARMWDPQEEWLTCNFWKYMITWQQMRMKSREEELLGVPILRY